MTAVPHNPELEAGLIGRLLAEPQRIPEVAGALLEGAHFHDAAHRLLFDALVEASYADEPLEPLVLGELHAKRLAALWRLDERSAIQRVLELPAKRLPGDPLEHARLVKRDADYRALLALADEIRDEVAAERDSPAEIAGVVSQRALAVAASTLLTQEIISFADAGRHTVRYLQQAKAAREHGVELGAYFAIPAIDDYVHGLQGGDVAVIAGEPGTGKTSVAWRAALNFAERMAKRAPEQRVGSLILSLEMTPTPSNLRFASMLTGLPGTDLREGRVSARDIQLVVDQWRERVDVPLWLNYAPTLRASQLRALVSEAIRRHNVGLVVLDHFRMFDLDYRLQNRNDEDEEKIRFLREQIAQGLNVGVICLAHTRKPDPMSNGRPRMADLRGSGQIAAHSDFVGFIFRPWMYASEDERDADNVKLTDAEMLWVKNRHGITGNAEFYFDPTKMFVG